MRSSSGLRTTWKSGRICESLYIARLFSATSRVSLLFYPNYPITLASSASRGLAGNVQRTDIIYVVIAAATKSIKDGEF
jgi:hypothetical protein